MHFLNCDYKQNKAFDSLRHATFPEGTLGTSHVRRTFPRTDFCSSTLQTLTSEKIILGTSCIHHLRDGGLAHTGEPECVVSGR